MNFQLLALLTATLVSAQGSALQACKGDRWSNELNKAIYIDQVEGFITTGNSLILRKHLPAKHRVVGGEYVGDFQYIQDRLTITVDDNNKVTSLSSALVSAQGSALQACKSDSWSNELSKAIYIDQVEGFITIGNSLILRKNLPAKHRIVGGKYVGDFQYIQDRLIIKVDQND